MLCERSLHSRHAILGAYRMETAYVANMPQLYSSEAAVDGRRRPYTMTRSDIKRLVYILQSLLVDRRITQTLSIRIFTHIQNSLSGLPCLTR
jgi:hypothetical protein